MAGGARGELAALLSSQWRDGEGATKERRPATTTMTGKTSLLSLARFATLVQSSTLSADYARALTPLAALASSLYARAYTYLSGRCSSSSTSSRHGRTVARNAGQGGRRV